MQSLDRFFKLKENNTSVATEIFAGLTTFMTIAYILIVHPSILAVTGMDWGAVFTATAISSAAATLMMAIYAKYPFALAPGMGINAFFAYTVGLSYGWQVALLAVFIEGLIFISLSFFKVREAIFDAIPRSMKVAVSAGIGLFITFIGLVNGGVVRMNIPDAPVGLGNLNSTTVILVLIGTVITMVLFGRDVKGSLLLGILATWAMGIVCQAAGLYVVDVDAGMYSLIPTGVFAMPPSVESVNIFVAAEHVVYEHNIGILEFVIVLFTFLFVDIFDTIGTIIGVSEKAGFLDKNGRLPRLNRVLLSDAVGTVIGSTLGTSTVTTYVESAAGVAVGGRTGLTALTVSALFAISLFFSPIFVTIPAFATAPPLVLVGFFMMQNVVKIDFKDVTEGIPAFLTIIMMPLTYSIAEGIIFGTISHVVLKFVTGRRKEVNTVMLVLAAIFVARLVGQAMGY